MNFHAALPIIGLMFLLSMTTAPAETVMETEGWDNTDEAFARFAERIESMHGRNLLARSGVAVYRDGKFATGLGDPLVDGQAGERCEEGRVMISGQPTVIAFYLGEPKTITQIGAFTFNGDMRSNQDFEVRLANNAKRPGKMPKFDKRAQLTTGEVILGNDRGGFHTRFVDSAGGPLVPEKVDWVQLSIWQTYPTKAGQPARTKIPSSSSAYIELEVLGEESDVVVPSAEQLAFRKAVREAPKKPELVKMETWQQTLIASREAIYEWETLQDRLATFSSGADFQPWYVLGPFSPKSKEAKNITRLKQIDLAARYPGKDGKDIGWVERKDLVDGPVHDLARLPGVEKGDVIFLCRPVTFHREFARSELYLDAATDAGSLRWLPSGKRVNSLRPVTTSRIGTELTAVAGEYQFLLELKADDAGRCRFRFSPQPVAAKPGAGSGSARMNRRHNLVTQLREESTDPIARAQLRWEGEDFLWSRSPQEKKTMGDWVPGHSAPFIEPRYRAAIERRLTKLENELTADQGVIAQAIAPMKSRIDAWIVRFRGTIGDELDPVALRAKYYQLAAVQEMLASSGRVRSLRLAVEDQRKTFGERYPRAGEFFARIDALDRNVRAAWERILDVDSAALEILVQTKGELDLAAPEILLANPVLAFDKLLMVKGNTGFSSNWGGPNSLGSEMVILSPVRPDGQFTTIHQGTVSDMDLHWDARRILFSDRSAVWEIGVDGTGLRRVTAEDSPVTHYDACYLPSGKIVCVSNACEQAVPCTGGPNVGNLHVMDADGANERRVTFDQDHDWNPVVMHDGRVLYTRWEYTDAPHYFSRLLFRMNPDGSNQKEYYGSNSYWPNATYWPRPIPGHPTMISCVVSGHHGVSRVGEMLLLDPAKGRHEANGAVQKIPGYGKKVEPTMLDRLVVDVWPRFAAPYPLAEPGTNLGGGKYFLACVQNDAGAKWDVCLVDVFDNITPIATGGYMSPIPLVARPMPPVVPSNLDLRRRDATIYVADVYQGPGLKGFPRGTVKQLRIGSHHYRYAGNGDTRASSLEGGWDVKKILGTVPVEEDGSALFTVPANTPIFVQPLDAQGKSQQVMRSWFSAMPGEFLSCVGCHEKQNAVPPSKYTTAAMGRRPSKIAPWHGPTRGLSFDREVQPVLDRRCVGCHNDQPYRAGDTEIATIDLRAKRLHGKKLAATDPAAPKNRFSDKDYSPAYLALQQYVRRPGYESDYHMPKPAEYEADTSTLVQLLKKGHYNVQLTDDEWRQLYTWIDYNIPYPANWRESHRPPGDDQVRRRAEYKKLYAGIDDRDEEPLPLPPIGRFEPPRPVKTERVELLAVDNWPLSAEQAAKLQQQTGAVEKELDLGDGVTMKCVLVPAGQFVMGDPTGTADERPQSAVEIKRPFYMGTFEVTNAQYAQFDSQHDSGVINERWKDRSRRGTPINQPEAPVVRISWQQAMAFCDWLSAKTGRRCTLPSEAQWEWACRAGTATRFSAGPYTVGDPAPANIADATAAQWNHGRAEPGYNDGVMFTGEGGRFAPNAWGLCDMHGNVAEWCATAYKAYPYDAADGRENPLVPGAKVVRGGSWNDTLRFATSASRWRYQPYKPVYNVGFRVVFAPEAAEVVATAEKE